MIFTLILGIIVGYVYFMVMEYNLPKESNCSYIANKWTDAFAILYGVIIIFFGHKYSNQLLIFLGITIIVEHIMQVVAFKLDYTTRKDKSKDNDRHHVIGKYEPAVYHANAIETLVRQSARYALAAEQDLSPLIAVLHANYAAGYLWALKDIATENEIDNVIGKGNLKKLEEYTTNVQDISTKRVSGACPEFIGVTSKHGEDIARLAGDL